MRKTLGSVTDWASRVVASECLWPVKIHCDFYGCTAWCSEIGSLTSLDVRNSGVFSDVREPISLHQAVLECLCLQDSWQCDRSCEPFGCS